MANTQKWPGTALPNCEDKLNGAAQTKFKRSMSISSYLNMKQFYYINLYGNSKLF